MAKSLADQMEDLKRKEHQAEQQLLQIRERRNQLVAPIRAKVLGACERVSKSFFEDNLETALRRRLDIPGIEQRFRDFLQAEFIQDPPFEEGDP